MKNKKKLRKSIQSYYKNKKVVQVPLKTIKITANKYTN